ncbi:hypothetical protein PMAYCL1PPCAC_30466 [Pristionchus mayeri]|uniref:Uncharacterized protein n=1 Tax=Pristionchus mayeri TaxID=1317129 RepID=A0AAN5IF00_9BILA|nr:hypothetical protein PMAYCL1PPCAC_30466 [Pristionchus mayeri]
MKNRQGGLIILLSRVVFVSFFLICLWFFVLQFGSISASRFNLRFQYEVSDPLAELPSLMEEENATLTDCQCRTSDGTVVEMCYRLPENPEIRGMKFSCDHVKYLEGLDLLNRRDTLVVDDTLEYTVIVTAASADFFHHVARLIDRSRKVHPDIRVIVYNLGMTPQQTFDLYSICNIDVRELDFLAYEPHLRNLHEFRWKPIIIAEALRQHDSFWYWDSSVVPTIGHFDRVADLIRCRDRQKFYSGPVPSVEDRDRREEMDDIPSGFDEAVHARNVEECKKYPYLLHSFTGHGIFAATHKDMYKYLPTNDGEIRKKKAKMFEAGLAYIVRRDEVLNDIVKWYVLCALEKDCMAPHNSMPACFFEGHTQYEEWAGCHRYDQSALNILLANVNHYDRHYYTSDIVDFFRIEREYDQDEEIDMASLACNVPMLVNNI